MLIINPTYRALPVSLHHKLTFILFFCLPLSLFSFHAPFPFPSPPLFSPSCSKVVHVKIIDDEEYEKNKNFFLELAEPRMVDMSLQKGAVLNLSLSLLSLPLSLALTRCLFSQPSVSPRVSSLPTSLLLYLLLSSPPASPLLFLHRCARKDSLSHRHAFMWHLPHSQDTNAPSPSQRQPPQTTPSSA